MGRITSAIFAVTVATSALSSISAKAAEPPTKPLAGKTQTNADAFSKALKKLMPSEQERLDLIRSMLKPSIDFTVFTGLAQNFLKGLEKTLNDHQGVKLGEQKAYELRFELGMPSNFFGNGYYSLKPAVLETLFRSNILERKQGYAYKDLFSGVDMDCFKNGGSKLSEIFKTKGTLTEEQQKALEALVLLMRLERIQDIYLKLSKTETTVKEVKDSFESNGIFSTLDTTAQKLEFLSKALKNIHGLGVSEQCGAAPGEYDELKCHGPACV